MSKELELSVFQTTFYQSVGRQPFKPVTLLPPTGQDPEIHATKRDLSSPFIVV